MIQITKLLLILFLTSCLSSQKSSLKISSFAKTEERCSEKLQFVEQSYIEGTFSQIISDNYEEGTFKVVNLLTDDAGAKYELDGESFSEYSFGDRIQVQGSQNVLISSDTLATSKINVSSSMLLDSKIQLIKSYELNVGMFIFDYNDRKSTDVYDLEQGRKDLAELADYMFRNSGGQIKFNIDVDGNGIPDVEVVEVNSNFTRCSPTVVRDARDRLSELNYDDYDLKIGIASESLSGNDRKCGYGGVANVGRLGSGKGTATHVAIPKFNVILHEVGHNLGLGHSGRPGVTYAHKICPMGNSFDNKVTYFNAAKTKMLGLFDDRPELERTVTESGSYEIQSIGLGVTATENDMPRIYSVKSESTTYYVEYRSKHGEDADMPSSVNNFRGINILTASLRGGGTSSYQKILNSPGETFNGQGVTFELEEGIDGEATKFKVTFSNSKPNPPQDERKCDNSKITTTLKEVSKSNDGFDLAIEIANENSDDCGELDFPVDIESEEFELVNNNQEISIPAKEVVDIVVSIVPKDSASIDKDKTYNLEIKLKNSSGKVSDKSIEVEIKPNGSPGSNGDSPTC